MSACRKSEYERVCRSTRFGTSRISSTFPNLITGADSLSLIDGFSVFGRESRDTAAGRARQMGARARHREGVRAAPRERGARPVPAETGTDQDSETFAPAASSSDFILAA